MAQDLKTLLAGYREEVAELKGMMRAREAEIVELRVSLVNSRQKLREMFARLSYFMGLVNVLYGQIQTVKKDSDAWRWLGERVPVGQGSCGVPTEREDNEGPVVPEEIPEEVVHEEENLQVVGPGEEILQVVGPGEEILQVVDPGQEILQVVGPGEEILQVVGPGMEILQVVGPWEEILQVVGPGEEILQVVGSGEEILQVVGAGEEIIQVLVPGEEILQLVVPEEEILQMVVPQEEIPEVEILQVKVPEKAGPSQGTYPRKWKNEQVASWNEYVKVQEEMEGEPFPHLADVMEVNTTPDEEEVHSSSEVPESVSGVMEENDGAGSVLKEEPPPEKRVYPSRVIIKPLRLGIESDREQGDSPEEKCRPPKTEKKVRRDMRRQLILQRIFGHAKPSKHGKLVGTANPKKRFFCRCGLLLTSNSKLNAHLRYHRREWNFECHHCRARFWQCSHLRKHLQQMHHQNLDATAKIFGCTHCGKMYGNLKLLTRHRRASHLPDKAADAISVFLEGPDTNNADGPGGKHEAVPRPSCHTRKPRKRAGLPRMKKDPPPALLTISATMHDIANRYGSWGPPPNLSPPYSPFREFTFNQSHRTIYEEPSPPERVDSPQSNDDQFLQSDEDDDDELPDV